MSFTLYGLFLLVCAWVVSRRCGTVVNPVSYFATVFGLQTLVAPILLSYLELAGFNTYRESDINDTMGLSALYLGAASAAFLLRASPFVGPLRAILPKKASRITGTTELFSRAQVVVLFAVLVYSSSAGRLWFTNPRLAYQTGRSGSGVWYVLCEASLIVAFGCTIYKKRRPLASVLLIGGVFATFAFFLGSKTSVLAYLVLGVFYADNSGCRVSKRALIGIATMAVVGIMSLQMMQGTAATVSDTVGYFDYFTNTTMFLSDFGRLFQYTHGQTLLSQVWFYVPRALYPAKPYAYGGTQIMATYYPGAAELGSTPGILAWAPTYWDFGAIGVAIDGLLAGLVASAAFHLFRRCASVWTFLLFAQVGLLAGPLTIYNTPFPLFIVWLTAESALFRAGAAFIAFGLALIIDPRRSLGVVRPH